MINKKLFLVHLDCNTQKLKMQFVSKILVSSFLPWQVLLKVFYLDITNTAIYQIYVPKIKACVWCRGAASRIHHHKTEKLFMAVKLVMNVCVPLQIC